MGEEKKEKKKCGAKPKTLNNDQIAQVETLAAVLSIEQIADYLGMSKVTFYKIFERQPDVLERYKKGKAKAIGTVAQGLLKQAREGNAAAAMFYLKTQAGWREKSDDSQSESPNPVTIQFVAVDGRIENRSDTPTV